LPGGEKRAASGFRIVDSEQAAIRSAVAANGERREDIFVAGRFAVGLLQQRQRIAAEVGGSDGAVEGDGRNRAILAHWLVALLLELREDRVGVRPRAALLERDRFVEFVAPAEPAHRIFALRRAV